MSKDHYEVEKVEDVADDTEANIDLKQPSGVFDILKENPLNIELNSFMYFIEANTSVFLEF